MAPVVVATPPPTMSAVATMRPAAPPGDGWGTYVVTSGDSLYTIAQRHGTTVRALVMRNRLSDGGRLIHPGQRLEVPGPAAAESPAKASATTPATPATSTYTVRSGDTLIGIAARHRTTARAIAALNGAKVSGIIKVGQRLRVPTDGVAAAKAVSSSKPSAASTAPAPATTTSYTVGSGDTLIGIAARHRTTARAIAALNGVKVSGIIKVGQRLRVPTDGAAAAKATTGSGRKSTPAPTQPEMSTEFNAGGYSAKHFPSTTVAAARKNHDLLAAMAVPTREEARELITATALRHGVEPALVLAIAHQESGFNQRQVSVANAIGLMQVIPLSGDWASEMVGRELNLLDAEDNVTAGVVILRALHRATTSEEDALAGYYQGLASVRKNGMYTDTERYVRNIQALRDRYT